MNSEKSHKKGEIDLPDSELNETQIVEITPEMLQGEEWKNAEFKRYDVNLPAPTPSGGRPHPMQSLIQEFDLFSWKWGSLK